MTAKIEAGYGWKWDFQGLKPTYPNLVGESLIDIIGEGNLLLQNNNGQSIEVSTQVFWTEISIPNSITDGKRKMLPSKSYGFYQMTKARLRDPASDPTLTNFVLSGEAMVQFGQPGDPGYFKVTHEMEQRKKLTTA